MPERRLCFGGSFNPIHLGHLLCARAAAETAGFDRIILIPAGQPPHKPADPALASPQDRQKMCQLAIQNDPLFEIDPIELDRPGPSYTIDTVRQLKKRQGAKVTWLIGADMAKYLPHWHDAVSLLEEADFLLLARPGWSFDWSTLPPPFQRLEANIVPAPLIEISSTDIRQRIAQGLSIRYLTPPEVIDHIQSRGLYR